MLSRIAQLPLHSYTFECIYVQIGSLAHSTSLCSDCLTHRLILCLRDEDTIQINQQSFTTVQGSCMFLAPDSNIECKDTTTEPIYYEASFYIFARGEQQPCREPIESLPYNIWLHPTPLSSILEYIQYMLRFFDSHKASPIHAVHSEIEINHFRSNLFLQQWILACIESKTKRSADLFSSALEAVQHTVDYIHQYYQKPITVEDLLHLSGVGRWKYIRLFQQLTGKKPLDYITDIRINRAKDLLRLSNHSIKEIAHYVGFKDEYYFSRRFSQSTGVPPRQYTYRYHRTPPSLPHHRYSLAPRIVATGNTLGDLLSLGIQPIGASLTVIRDQVIYQQQLLDISDIGTYGEPEQIARLQPDLIIHEYTTDEVSVALARIAPTFVIYRHDPAHIRLRAIANWIGQGRQADQWLSLHQQQSVQVWKDCIPIKQGETALVIIQIDGDLFVMGGHGFALTIYQPFAFCPPPAVSQMIQQQIPYLAINWDDLERYASDRVFLLVDRDATSLEYLHQLTHSPAWKRLQIQSPFHLHITESKWNFDDPITREHLLSVLPNILKVTF
ncbi:helix-turn-helix domain-containing protein [Paenibacillus kyungheensis]